MAIGGPNEVSYFKLQGDYVRFNTGNRENPSSSQADRARPDQLLGCSFVSLHFRCCNLRSHPVLHAYFHVVRSATSVVTEAVGNVVEKWEMTFRALEELIDDTRPGEDREEEEAPTTDDKVMDGAK